MDDDGNENKNGPNAANGDAAAETATATMPVMMSSFFPSPPSYIANFTPANIALAKRLVALPSFALEQYKRDYDPATWKARQAELLLELNGVDETTRESVKDIDLVGLVQPPDVSLIEEDGHWMSFGQAWPIREELPSLEAMGVKQLYTTPHNFEGRRRALHALLHTLLHTYLRLLTILTQGPPSLVEEEAAFHRAPHDPTALRTQSDSAIEHIRIVAINIHHICNEWRPIQARETMKLMMRNQIDDRKEKITEIQSATKAIRQRLQGLKTRGVHPTGAELAEDVGTMQLTADDGPGPANAKEAATRKMQAALDAIGD